MADIRVMFGRPKTSAKRCRVDSQSENQAFEIESDGRSRSDQESDLKFEEDNDDNDDHDDNASQLAGKS